MAARVAHRVSRADQAVRLIRERIFQGDLRPGDRVPQDGIAADLGMSRIPVREALIALEQEGWITIERHRGAFISGLDEAAVRDHYNLFGLLYGHAARRALTSDCAGLTLRLREVHGALLAATDPKELGRLSVAFNAAIVDAAGSTRIKVVLRSMTPLVPGEFFELVAPAVEIERGGTTAILAAIEACHHEGVTAAFAEMMNRLGAAVSAVFAARGLLDWPDAREAPDSRGRPPVSPAGPVGPGEPAANHHLVEGS